METVRHLVSIKQIQKQYITGDLPVLVVCSDKEAYICKYMPSTNSALSWFVSWLALQWQEHGVLNRQLPLLCI